MKIRFLIPFCVVINTLYSQKTVNMNELVINYEGESPCATLMSNGKYFTGYAESYGINEKLEIKQEYKKGKLKNESYYYENGIVKSVIHYDEIGREQGKYKEWDSLGRLTLEGEYLKGERQGIWTFYQWGKLIKMGEYTLGKMNGVWKYLDFNGNIIRREFYVDGELQKTEIY